jgi:glycosyltransferase involved in cell wall biosynthesis
MKQKSILLVADSTLPVPPPLYGGVERILDFLAEGLSSSGWDVSLACHQDSTCKINKLPYPATGNERNTRLKNLGMLLPHYITGRFDLVHSFAHFDLALPLWPFKQHVIQSFQSIPHWGAFSKRIRLIPKRNLYFTTCGYHMVDHFSSIAPTIAIHNGVKINQFDFKSNVSPDAPLVFLGRIERIKGTHTAIKIANACGRRLIIAGNRSEDSALDSYFRNEIEPYLSESISYIGPVNDEQKNIILGNAAALLMPIEWDEPFGIVMAEALACGTPVIGNARGALPEIIRDGITGRACQSIDEMIKAVIDVNSLSRIECRLSAEQSFSSDVIIDQYVKLYESITTVCL